MDGGSTSSFSSFGPQMTKTLLPYGTLLVKWQKKKKMTEPVWIPAASTEMCLTSTSTSLPNVSTELA